MTRYLVTLHTTADRERACKVIRAAPQGSRVEIKNGKRSLPQNKKLWSMLSDVAMQKEWHGVRFPPSDWKLIFMDALSQELRTAPNLNGNGFVNLGRSSSDLSREEMSNLLELIAAFGAQHSIVFHGEEVPA